MSTTLHFMKFSCSGDTFKTIRARMTEAAWAPGDTRGFGMVGEDPNVIHGALYSEVAHTLKKVFDPNKRTEEDEIVRRMGRTRFILDFKRGQLAAYHRADLKTVIEALDGLPDVVFSTADYKINVHALLEELGENYNRHEIAKLGVADYIEPVAAMIADVGFKMSDAREGYKAKKRYKDQISAFTLLINNTRNGQAPHHAKVAVNSRGSVMLSDDVTEELRDYVIGLLNKHDAKGEPAERHGVNLSREELLAERALAEALAAHGIKDEQKQLARNVMDVIDARLSGRTKDADEATAKAVRELRKAAKKCGGLEIIAGGKTAKIA